MTPSALDAIEIRDFRGFPADVVPPIRLCGQHLLLYGENGSGKSTIFEALARLLDRKDAQPFNHNLADAGCLKHRFTDAALSLGRVSLHFTTPDPAVPLADMTWSIDGDKPTGHVFYADLSRSRGFLDYRAVLQTHFVHRNAHGINLFALIVENLLREVELQTTRETVGAAWDDLKAAAGEWVELANRDPAGMDDFEKASYPFGIADAEDDEEAEVPDFAAHFRQYVDDQERQLSERIDRFNDGLFALVRDIERLANTFIATFDPVLTVEFDFVVRIRSPEPGSGVEWAQEPQLLLRARFRGELLEHPGTFLNEARLTAIAICFYLAALKAEVPEGYVATCQVRPLLVLDDVLIGLDMGNRLPLLDLIDREFARNGWQVMLFTFDREFYDVAKQRLEVNKWLKYELFVVRVDNDERPLLLKDRTHLERARGFLNSGETKAAAVHVRTQFEESVKEAGAKLAVRVRYTPAPRATLVNELWEELKKAKMKTEPLPGTKQPRGAKPEAPIIEPELAQRLELARKWVLNPLSHSQSIDAYRAEILRAIDAVEEFTQVVASLKGSPAADRPDAMQRDE